MGVCPVWHCTRWPNTSHWSLSSVKCFMGLGDSGILLEMVNHCFLGALCQLWVPAVWVVDLAQQRAKALDIPIGAFQASCVASLLFYTLFQCLQVS